jgi:hypothetical protein
MGAERDEDKRTEDRKTTDREMRDLLAIMMPFLTATPGLAKPLLSELAGQAGESRPRRKRPRL